MIETYAFLAAFTAQILAMSVLYPAWCIRYVRAKATDFPTERFAQLYPGVDHSKTLERHLTLFRVLNTSIAVLGLLLLGWMFGNVQRPDWDDGPGKDLAAVYFLLQSLLPHFLIALLGVRYSQVLKRLVPEGKRKAILQRRGLFDFVSPFIVSLAVMGYVVFAAFAVYVEQNPFPGFGGALFKIGGVTLMYATMAFFVYVILHRPKSNPLETHADRMYGIGLGVRFLIYTCTAAVVFGSLDLAIGLLRLQRWEPFAQSVFFVTCAFLSFMVLKAPPRQQEVDGPGGSAIS